MAFSRLITMESQWGYATAKAVLGRSADAEDAFQEACLRAWRDLPKLRQPEMWSVWFRRIVINAAIDTGRAARRIKRLELPAEPPAPDHSSSVAARDEVYRALAGLAPQERVLLVLRYGHDLALAEIARLMNVSLGTTKSRLHRALEKLRNEMESRP